MCLLRIKNVIKYVYEVINNNYNLPTYYKCYDMRYLFHIIF